MLCTEVSIAKFSTFLKIQWILISEFIERLLLILTWSSFPSSRDSAINNALLYLVTKQHRAGKGHKVH